MDFRSELAKWGYNKGNSIDVETLIDEILPSLLSKQERSYSEEDLTIAFDAGESFGSLPFSSMSTSNRLSKEEWFEQFKKK